MILYTVIMLAVSVLFLGLGIAIYRGNTGLIHDYHQKKVRESERLEYARAFSKGMFVISTGLAASGAVALLGETKTILNISMAVMAAGLAVGLVIIGRVQKRYNGGFF